MLDVVAVVDEVGRHPVEERRIPRLAVHLVRVRDDAIAEEVQPDAIDERAREAPVACVGEDLRNGGAPRIQRGRRWRTTQLRIEKPGLGVLIEGAIASEQLQLRVW